MSPDVIERANPREIPRSWVAACGALIAVGVVTFVAGPVVDFETAWRAYPVNTIYYATLAQGGLCLACAFVIIGARWTGPIRHVAAALAAWVPVTFVLVALSYFGREAIYTAWISGAPHGKEAWLNIPRLYITDLAILGLLSLLSLRFLKLAFRPALHGVAESTTIAARSMRRSNRISCSSSTRRRFCFCASSRNRIAAHSTIRNRRRFRM